MSRTLDDAAPRRETYRERHRRQRRQEFLDIGMFDTVLSLFFNDVDLCRRLAARGRRIRFIAESEVRHHEGASTSKRSEEFGNSLWESNRRSYFRKWTGRSGSAFVATSIAASAVATTLRILLGPRKLREKMSAVKRRWAFARRCLGHR
jgi:GT2 family glycosyltransferase